VRGDAGGQAATVAAAAKRSAQRRQRRRRRQWRDGKHKQKRHRRQRKRRKRQKPASAWQAASKENENMARSGSVNGAALAAGGSVRRVGALLRSVSVAASSMKIGGGASWQMKAWRRHQRKHRA
jgi:hypothetical protein